MANLMSQRHYGVSFARLDVVVDESDEGRVETRILSLLVIAVRLCNSKTLYIRIKLSKLLLKDLYLLKICNNDTITSLCGQSCVTLVFSRPQSI